MCNYNSALRDTHKHTKEVKNNDKSIHVEGMNKNCSDFRMCSKLSDYLK